MDKTIRIPKRRGYTIVPNGLLVDGKLSARAWGIYVYLLSRPDGWEVRARHLTTVFTEGRDAIYASLKQLVSVGLMDLETYRNEDGLPRKRYVLVDHDKIFNSPNPDFQDTGNQDPDFQDSENPAGTITELTSKKENQYPAANQYDYTSDPSESDDSYFTSKQSFDATKNPLPKADYLFLRQQLQDVGKSISEGQPFFEPPTQELWEEFVGHIEEATEHYPWGDYMLNLVEHQTTVGATVADEYEAGVKLTKLLKKAVAEG